jgi:AraC family transcriptional regulator, regulatory protein of adaptative response / methylated-DNA-[protein]-cysteine methyltransferase
MKTSDLGLVFDDKVSKTLWANIDIEQGQPEKLWFGTVPVSIGKMTVIGAGKSLCYLGFEQSKSIERCSHFFKSAEFSEDIKKAEKMVTDILDIWNGRSSKKLTLIVNGTEFQTQVWQALMKIPTGHVVSYGTVAKAIGHPKAVRAVGSAVGANPVSLLIPCHRVVQQSGKVENYGWGDAMKQGILQVEAIN